MVGEEVVDWDYVVGVGVWWGYGSGGGGLGRGCRRTVAAGHCIGELRENVRF